MISTTLTEEKKRSFRITGMTCATCAMIVERALMKVDGVKFAAVNLATETAFVILEKDVPQVILEEAVKKQVTAFPTNLGRTLKFAAF